MSYANGAHERRECFGLTEMEFQSGKRNAPRPGDEIRWGDAPAGALALAEIPPAHAGARVREHETGNTVGIDRGPDSQVTFWACSDGSHRPAWVGWSEPDTRVRIVALGLTGQETAEDIRRLAGL